MTTSEATKRRRRLRRLGAGLPLAFGLWLLAGWVVAEVVTAPKKGPIESRDVLAGATVSDVSAVTEDGIEVHGWLAQSSERDVVLLFPGHGGNRRSLLGVAEHYLARNWSVLLPDLRATGTSGGDQIGLGYQERLDVRAWMDLARDSGFVNIGLHGQSLGAAAITYSLVESDGDPAAFLVLDSCYDDIRNALANRLPWLPLPSLLLKPVEWFATAKINAATETLRPLACVESIRSPVLFVAGDSDSKVLPSEATQLFEACGSTQKRILWISGGRHTDLWSHDATGYASGLDGFLETLPVQPAAAASGPSSRR